MCPSGASVAASIGLKGRGVAIVGIRCAADRRRRPSTYIRDARTAIHSSAAKVEVPFFAVSTPPQVWLLDSLTDYFIISCRVGAMASTQIS